MSEALGTTDERETPVSETPELDKQSAIIKSGKAATVQDFYDWLTEQGYVLAKYATETTDFCKGVRRDLFDPSNCDRGEAIKTVSRMEGERGERKRVILVQEGQECPNCGGTGDVKVTYVEPRLEAAWINPEQMMADFFGIDRDRIETERRGLLERLREANAGR